MKKSILVFGLAIALLSSCGSEENTATRIDSFASLPIPADTITPAPKMDSDTMKTSTPNPAEQSSGTGKEVEVSEGIVYCTIPNCSGSQPIVEEKKRSILLTNTTLKLKNAKGEYVVTTNDKGIFRSGIPAGQYDVYVTEQTNKKIYNVSPETCADCFTKAMGNVIIQKGIQASFVVHFRCGPGDKKRS